MSTDQLLGLLLESIFVLLGVVTAIDYWRYGEKTRRDIALMFASLGIPFLLDSIKIVTGAELRWTNYLVLGGLMSQPYFMLRLIEYFRRVPQRLMQFTRLCVGLCWATAILYWVQYVEVPVPVQLVMIAYFVFVNGYAMIALVRSALTASGIVRRRLRFAAAGSGLLAAFFLTLALAALVPSIAPIAGFLIILETITATTSYYIGFAPPRWLRRAWQLTELRNFLLRVSSKPVGQRLNVAESLSDLSQSAILAVAGSKAVIAQLDETQQQWVLRYSTDQTEFSQLQQGEGIIQSAWQQRIPMLARAAGNANALDRRFLEMAGADTLLIAPIATTEHAWGMLLVFLEHSSLFIEDDLELIALFAQQSAMFLENSILVDKLHNYSAELGREVEKQTLELRESRAEILKLNVELEQRVNERTAQLNTLNRELEAFSYSVSHDLRAPVRVLDGFSKALLEDYSDKLDEDGQRYLNRIRASSQHMSQLIDGLLQLAHLSRASIEMNEVDLSRLARMIGAGLQEQYTHVSVEFVVKEGLVVRGDERMLRAALTNLLSNAWKFSSKQAQPRVEFGSALVDEQPTYFVRDNGAGFDMAYADKLFGAFQRLHHSSEFEGTGIGLATVERIIGRHGGKIWAEAAVNQGATFYFTVAPQTKVAAPEVADIASLNQHTSVEG